MGPVLLNLMNKCPKLKVPQSKIQMEHRVPVARSQTPEERN